MSVIDDADRQYPYYFGESTGWALAGEIFLAFLPLLIIVAVPVVLVAIGAIKEFIESDLLSPRRLAARQEAERARLRRQRIDAAFQFAEFQTGQNRERGLAEAVSTIVVAEAVRTLATAESDDEALRRLHQGIDEFERAVRESTTGRRHG